VRVAILGMGAIGHVIARALEGRVELVRIDRTRSPLRDGEAPVDAAVVSVKTYGTPWAADVAARVVSSGGVVATVQNGLGNLEALAKKIPDDRISLGAIYVGAEMIAERLEATGAGRIELGRPRHAEAGAHLDALAAAMRDGGMTVDVVDDPWPTIWRKLLVNAALNPTTAMFGLRNPEVPGHPAAHPLADELARETARVATAAGVAIDPAKAPGMWQAVAAFVNRSSMLQDLEAGRPTEIDAINGAIAREGARRGVDAPVNEAIALLVKAVEKKS
jgi:2-dehydropantoate 2-reductase